MAYLSDLLVAAAALGAAFYCFILSRRLQALSKLDGGLGSAIALLSAQVDDLSRTLNTARANADKEAKALDAQISRAESACGRLDLLLATLHDLPGTDAGTVCRDEAGPVRHAKPPLDGEGPAPDSDDRAEFPEAPRAAIRAKLRTEPKRQRNKAVAAAADPGATEGKSMRARIVRRRRSVERA